MFATHTQTHWLYLSFSLCHSHHTDNRLNPNVCVRALFDTDTQSQCMVSTLRRLWLRTVLLGRVLRRIPTLVAWSVWPQRVRSDTRAFSTTSTPTSPVLASETVFSPMGFLSIQLNLVLFLSDLRNIDKKLVFTCFLSLFFPWGRDWSEFLAVLGSSVELLNWVSIIYLSVALGLLIYVVWIWKLDKWYLLPFNLFSVWKLCDEPHGFWVSELCFFPCCMWFSLAND